MAATAGSLLLIAGVALAVNGGLLNGGFENGFDKWTVQITREDGTGNRTKVYGPNTAPIPCDDSTYGICLVGQDTFQADHDGRNVSPDQSFTVKPTDGEKMVRMGGPFHDSGQNQSMDRYELHQSFVADGSTLQVNFNSWTFDYSGFDEATFRVSLSDEDGPVATERIQGAFGPGGDTQLKTTGWQPVVFDLSQLQGEQLHLRITSAGTSDTLYGWWTYVDAGVLPEPPVSGEGMQVNPVTAPDGKPVPVTAQTNEQGQTTFQVTNSNVAKFGGCMPLTISFPINPGAGTVSSVKLLNSGTPPEVTMSNGGSGNLWTGTITCIAEGPLRVSYSLTEEGVTQSFIVPLGGIDLIDPRGIVHDKAVYDAAVAGGATEDAAREQAALSGATVRLQRDVGSGVFQNVLSGDPGITPNVNPQTTGTDGVYAWDVSPGDYRVRVVKSGYVPVISRVVTIPPIVLDLHVAMEALDTTIGGGPSGPTTSRSAAFTLGSNDPAATFECSLDGGAFAPCPASHSLSGLADGAHSLAVRASGPESGTDATAAVRNWVVDNAGPVVKIVGGPPKKGKARNASLVFKSEPGATFRCKLDGGSFAPCKSPKKYAKLAYGAHTFRVRATDALGNAGPEAKRSWTVQKPKKKGKKGKGKK